MELQKYLDSTYLKTPEQSGLSVEETLKVVKDLTDEAIDNQIFAVMIRPDYVKEIKTYLADKNTDVKVGTVIGFHEGTYSVEEKLAEAKKAIEDGVDELDFVINFEEYKKGNLSLVEKEVVECTKFCLDNQKIAKWIIEIAALTDEQIADITKKIATWVTANFEGKESMVFVKSSTGFYKTEGGKPNGATFEGIKIMKDHAGKLPVKAAGGVRTPADAEKMIKEFGVTRIGTSSAKALLQNEDTKGGY
ncbi:MAG: deoxyribose-phosphate aldolase [Bergeyella zoohelcum]|nr:deoxyribose-phosphate aldolase [Bergeyella zoohelcum]